MNQPPADATISEAVRDLLPTASAAWLFGSAAKGRWTMDSDLDIAVDLPVALEPAERWDLALTLADRLGAPVDLLDFRRLHTVMQVQILDTGRLLFTTDLTSTASYGGFVHTEYQHMQRWRQPLMQQLAQRLGGKGVTT